MQGDFYVKYYRAYQQAEDVAAKLFARFMKDFENMKSEKDGMQTLGDLREFATRQSLVSVLHNRVGIPVSTIDDIVNTSAIRWLSEVALKQLLFFLLLMGKGAEVQNMHTAIDLLPHGREIAGDSLQLAREFSDLDTTDQRNFERMSEIFRQTMIATPQTEKDREKFS